MCTGLFISSITIDLFQKVLHIPGSIYTCALKQLRSLNKIDGIEMNQVACYQLPKQVLLVFYAICGLVYAINEASYI